MDSAGTQRPACGVVVYVAAERGRGRAYPDYWRELAVWYNPRMGTEALLPVVDY